MDYQTPAILVASYYFSGILRLFLAQPTASPIPFPTPTVPIVIPAPTPTLTPTLPTPPATLTLEQSVENQLAKLELGQILFNPPQEMQVGVQEKVEVRITKEDLPLEVLTEGLRGTGDPIIEEIPVNTFMSARLHGAGFDITSLSHEEQLVASQGFTPWDWDITPLKSGIQTLSLTVTVRIRIPEFEINERKDYPVFEKDVKVRVNVAHIIRNFTGNNWKWILGTIGSVITTLVGWGVWKTLRNKAKAITTKPQSPVSSPRASGPPCQRHYYTHQRRRTATKGRT